MQNHTETWKYIFIYLLGADKIPAGPWGVISVQSIYICGKNTFNVNKWCMLLNVSFFDDLGKKLNVPAKWILWLFLIRLFLKCTLRVQKLYL